MYMAFMTAVRVKKNERGLDKNIGKQVKSIGMVDRQ
jgi:hypothetical protein